MDTAPPSLHTLLEIRKYCPEALDQLDVVVDGGIKRGTDVVKALCLGAKAVGIGRAALFGLGAGGIVGVERVLEILRDETATAMRFLGVEKVEKLGPRHVNTRMVERDIYDGPAGMDGLQGAVKRLWVKAKLWIYIRRGRGEWSWQRRATYEYRFSIYLSQSRDCGIYCTGMLPNLFICFWESGNIMIPSSMSRSVLR